MAGFGTRRDGRVYPKPRYRSAEETKREMAEIRAEVLASEGYSSRPLTPEEIKQAKQMKRQYERFGLYEEKVGEEEIEDKIRKRIHEKIAEERKKRMPK